MTYLFFLRLVPAGEKDGEEAAQRRPSCLDYSLHFLCMFWKVVFACIPPTEYWNGWACFAVSVLGIGCLSALIGDLASHLGCTVGLRDSVTALVLVALGTSLPGKCFLGLGLGLAGVTALVPLLQTPLPVRLLPLRTATQTPAWGT